MSPLSHYSCVQAHLIASINPLPTAPVAMTPPSASGDDVSGLHQVTCRQLGSNIRYQQLQINASICYFPCYLFPFLVIPCLFLRKLDLDRRIFVAAGSTRYTRCGAVIYIFCIYNHEVVNIIYELLNIEFMFKIKLGFRKPSY